MFLTLLIIGVLLIFIPSAEITLTLPSQSYSPSTPIKLTATDTSRQDVKLHTVPAQQPIFTQTVGPLMGMTQVGGKATGYVAFTNTGSHPLTIPTGIVVATKSGVQFLTLGSAVVPAAGTSPGTFPGDPIAAQNAGSIGNVVANTITIIPGDSINAIAQASGIAPSSVSLTVNNPSATSGGKAGNTSNGTTNDINALKKMLHQQMQTQFRSWLEGQLHNLDVAGKSVPDVLGSPNPLPEEKFTIGSVGADGSFTGTDSLRVTLLVVRSSDLQAAAKAELNAALADSNQYHGYVLIPQQPIVLGKISSTSSSDGKSLTVSFTPTGLIGQHLSNNRLDSLRSSLAGKGLSDATSFLASNASGLKGIVNSQVTLFPSFFPNIPFWTAHISIRVTYQIV